MGTYYIPRNVGGESRILYIFTAKSLIVTAAFTLVGALIMLILSTVGLKIVGIIIMALLAVIGFGVSSIKIPTLGGIKFTKKVGGDSLDEIIIRYLKFRKNKKLYVYTKEEK